jgi:signal transduction histidine kinase
MKKKVNILMVDDHPGKLLSYEAILAELGQNLIKAASGNEALEQLLKNDIAVVLIDVNMPGMNGFELAAMIRQHPRFEQTAMIFISAVQMTDLDRLKGYERGGVDYISVPIAPDLLRAKVKMFVELHRKSQQLAEKNQQLRLLSSRLLAAQDVERRRIARNLHDSLGQYLASVKMNLDLVSPCVSSGGAAFLSSAKDSLDECIAETRTISHLLHPPLLDEAGFGSAARWYVEGFAKRSGIDARLDLQEGIERLPKLTEVALFRILQESLTNVHRHSGSSSVEIQLKTTAGYATLTVRDFGRGMPAELLDGFDQHRDRLGVGLSGMRERVSDLGGQLDIRSDQHGTTIVATVPLRGTAFTDSAKSDETLSTTLQGTVEKIIEPPHPSVPEKAQIVVEGAEEFYREIRIDNTLKDEKGQDVALKQGAPVNVTIEADPEDTIKKKD